MKITLLCIGKPREQDLIRLHDRYATRLTRFGIQYDTDFVGDVQAGGRFSDDHVREREARALLERLERTHERGVLNALDATGRLVTSTELSARLERDASRRMTFVIGGPLGLHRTLLDRADWVWSLSPLTFPHEWVRSMVAEQLYRAISIQRGLPYHK